MKTISMDQSCKEIPDALLPSHSEPQITPSTSPLPPEILNFAITAGIINLGSIRTQYEETERMKLLDSYEYKIFESGGRWYCRLPDGRRIKRKNREDVESEIIKIQKERAQKEKELTGKKPVDLFTEWNDSRLEKGVIQGATALRYRKTCDKYIKNAVLNKIPMKRITRKEWTAFLQDIYEAGSPIEKDPKRKITAKELGRIKCIVKGIIDYAEDEGLISYTSDEVISHVRTDMHGFRHSKHSAEDEVYYPDELQALKSYCLSNPDPYTRCILLAIITGERIGECAALLAEDINLEEHCIYVQRTETQADETGRQQETIREGAKTDAGVRRVAIPENSLEWVRGIKDISERTGGGYLFKQEPGRYRERYVGERVRASQVRRHLKKICAELGISYKPPHKFRKTYASILKAADIDDQMIIEQMGHTDISTTENVYIKNRNRMEEKSCKLGKIDELRLDPVKEDASDLNLNCQVIRFPGKSHPDANSSHPEVFTKI